MAVVNEAYCSFCTARAKGTVEINLKEVTTFVPVVSLMDVRNKQIKIALSNYQMGKS